MIALTLNKCSNIRVLPSPVLQRHVIYIYKNMMRGKYQINDPSAFKMIALTSKKGESLKCLYPCLLVFLNQDIDNIELQIHVV